MDKVMAMYTVYNKHINITLMTKTKDRHPGRQQRHHVATASYHCDNPRCRQWQQNRRNRRSLVLIWWLACQNQVLRTGKSNYIPRYTSVWHKSCHMKVFSQLAWTSCWTNNDLRIIWDATFYLMNMMSLMLTHNDYERYDVKLMIMPCVIIRTKQC